MNNFFRSVMLATVVTMIFQTCKEEDPKPVMMPEASFTYEKLAANCIADCEVVFINASTNAEDYVWDFGDNSGRATDDNPTHIYAEPGTYQVTLEAIAGDLKDDTVITVTLSSQVFVVNNGNFGQGNGSISIYDENEQTIVNTAVMDANGGEEIGAGIESMYIANNTGYVLCNAPDKVEFIDANTLEFIDNPVSNINTPRYMTTIGNSGFVSCWGPFSPTFSLENSYVAVMDLDRRAIVDTLECGSGPEGIFAVGNKLFIANSYETSITVYNVSSGNSTTINVEAAPQHFELDNSGLLWVSLGSGFGIHGQDKVGLQAIDPVDNSLAEFVNFPGISDDGEMASDRSGGKIYFLTAEPFPATATSVYALNTDLKTIGNNAVIEGQNFYGIGFNPASQHIYIADAAAFGGPGKIMIYDTQGSKLDERVTSIGPYHFLFN